MEKTYRISFISQSFAFKGEWVKSICEYIEKRFGDRWEDVVMQNIDFSSNAGFSEYKCLGICFYEIIRSRWRLLIISGAEKLNTVNVLMLSLIYDYIAFEEWDRVNE